MGIGIIKEGMLQATRSGRRYSRSGEMPFVTWLQMLHAIAPGRVRHGIAIGGKGWSIRGIMMMHLEIVSEKKRRDYK